MDKLRFSLLKKVPDEVDIQRAKKMMDDLPLNANLEDVCLIVRERLNQNRIEAEELSKIKLRLDGGIKEKYLHDAVDAWIEARTKDNSIIFPLISEIAMMLRAYQDTDRLAAARDDIAEGVYYFLRARTDEDKPINKVYALLEQRLGKERASNSSSSVTTSNDAKLLSGESNTPPRVENNSPPTTGESSNLTELAESQLESQSVVVKCPAPGCDWEKTFDKKWKAAQSLRGHYNLSHSKKKEVEHAEEQKEESEEPKLATPAGKLVRETGLDRVPKRTGAANSKRGRPSSPGKKRGD